MKGLITRNVHVKYESPTYGSRNIGNVKVFPQTHGQADRQEDRHTDRQQTGQKLDAPNLRLWGHKNGICNTNMIYCPITPPSF